MIGAIGAGAGAILRSGFNLPPAGETRFVSNEVLVDSPAGDNVLGPVAARLNITQLETIRIGLTGRTLHRWQINGGQSVLEIIRAMSRERVLAGAQAMFLYRLAQQKSAPAGEQYVPQKLNLIEAHRLATGNQVLVAVIDSRVDASHGDLAGAITENFDAAQDGDAPHAHGTGMAGAIAARQNIQSAAPRVGLLTVQAFSSKGGSAEGTTLNILKGIDWAVTRGARIINMSFAGPPDPRLNDAIQKAARRGVVMIAAAGNAGPNSPPLYPAADPNVIAVTATDSNDAVFKGANRGNYISVAAPGVDVLVPAPAGTYQFTTGTSVAAAEVSGVAALLLERNPKLTAAEVRNILMRTAKNVSGQKGKDKEYGAGLVNAYDAVSAAGAK